MKPVADTLRELFEKSAASNLVRPLATPPAPSPVPSAADFDHLERIARISDALAGRRTLGAYSTAGAAGDGAAELAVGSEELRLQEERWPHVMSRVDGSPLSR